MISSFDGLLKRFPPKKTTQKVVQRVETTTSHMEQQVANQFAMHYFGKYLRIN